MLHRFSVEELYLLHTTTIQDARIQVRYLQVSLHHKARNPIIGASKRAKALRVALSPAFAFCAIAPVD